MADPLCDNFLIQIQHRCLYFILQHMGDDIGVLLGHFAEILNLERKLLFVDLWVLGGSVQ